MQEFKTCVRRGGDEGLKLFTGNPWVPLYDVVVDMTS
jgi:hypothetical protein